MGYYSMNWLVGLDWGIQWGTVFTVAGTLTAAFLGQVFSHRYSQKREDLKQKKESFQNLYSPTIHHVTNYLYKEIDKQTDIIFNYKDEEDFADEDDYFNPEKLFLEAFSLIGDNLKYANLELIMQYQDIKSTNKLGKQFLSIDKTIILCDIFITDYIKISKEIGVYSPNIKKKIEGILLFTKLYYLLLKMEGLNFAYTTLSYADLLDKVGTKNTKYIKNAIQLQQKYEKYAEKNALNGTHTKRLKKLESETYKLLCDIGKQFEPMGHEISDSWADHINKLKR